MEQHAVAKLPEFFLIQPQANIGIRSVAGLGKRSFQVFHPVDRMVVTVDFRMLHGNAASTLIRVILIIGVFPDIFQRG